MSVDVRFEGTPIVVEDPADVLATVLEALALYLSATALPGVLFTT